MLQTLAALKKRNRFAQYTAGSGLYYDRPGPGANARKVVDFFLKSRGSPAVYDCHTFFVDFFGSTAIRAMMDGDVSDVHLINVMRNPVQRYKSRYYYAVDPKSRLRGKALAEQRKRAADPCGCADMSFNDCVSQAAATNSSCSENADLSNKASTILHFLSQNDFEQYQKVSCNPSAAAPLVRKAMAHMEEYTVIGLSERMGKTMALLEERLPGVFAGAAMRFKNGKINNQARATHIPKRILSQGALVSAETEAILRDNPCNEGEFALWEHAKLLFHNATGLDVADL